MRLFEQKIHKLQFKQNLIIVLKFALLALAVFILSFDLFFVVHSHSGNHLRELFLFALALKISLFLIFLYLILQANHSVKNKLQTARQLDEFNQDKTDTFQNALELQSEVVEPEILELILTRADSRAQSQQIKTEKHYLSPLWQVVLLLYLASAFLFILNPQEYLAARDFFALRSQPQVQHKELVELVPGDVSLTRNSKLMIEVLDPEPEVEHYFFYRIAENWREEPLIEYKKIFNNLDFSFSYFVKTPFASSDTFTVKVYELPIIKEIEVRYKYPEYTNLKSEVHKNASGSIKAIIGTKVNLTLHANNPLQKAEMIFSNGNYSEMERQGISSFSDNFVITQSGSYHIRLEDILGNNSRKISNIITTLADKEPEIEISKPGKDTLLTQNMLLPLTIYASDDYGLEQLDLRYQINNEQVFTEPILNILNSRTITHNYTFDLNNNVLIPGDNVTYWVEISDNCPQPHSVVSKKYNARFPSIEEIYKEIEQQEKEKSSILKETLQNSEQLQKEFEEKRRELLNKEELSWEDKKELENLLNKQSDLNENVKQVASDFNDLIKKFENNNAISSETLDKMKKIQELIEEIANDELKDALAEMQKKMDKINPEDLTKAMQDFKFSLEDFSEKLEQTLKLLEDIKKEQSLQKAVEIAEEMEEMQNELNRKTSERSQQNENLAEEQKKISDKLDNLTQQLQDLERSIDEKQDAQLLEELKKLQEMMQQDSLALDLEKSSENLEQGNMEEAKQSQQQASSKMMKLKQQLQKMQQSMASGMMVDASEILEKTIKRLLIFSQYQEKVAQSYIQDPFLILPDEISIFESIDRILKDLYEVPMIILVIGPKFLYDANSTFNAFRELFQYINDAKRAKVETYLEDIQKGMNLMIFDLMQASSNMQQGGGGGGMQSMMQALQQMGQQQMMLNMITQQMMMQISENGSMSREMRSQAQKLARDEQRLAENLKRMLQSNSEAQKQTSAMNKIIGDLDSIAHDIKRGKIDQELIDKQQRILSRLLDAQRSIHKREFSRERKREISEIENWNLPEEIKLKFDKMRKEALLKDDFLELPPEYQELIKEYLKLLNERYDEE
ncbi:MAG: hypothetical protein K9N07_08815 [Candidatus Cloacimonetes bacterium]|nr:hypothetical protein [Candidatus Cloacimonadota bacterium]